MKLILYRDSYILIDMTKKYTLKATNNPSLFRLVAGPEGIPSKKIKPFQKGGLVSGEHNLSQEGTCWVTIGAKVLDQAQVSEDAFITDSSLVRDHAKVSGSVLMEDNATVEDYATVTGNVELRGRATVAEEASVSGEVEMYDETQVCGDAVVTDKVGLEEWARVFGGHLSGDFTLSGSIVWDNEDYHSDDRVTLR